ncbi:MAG: Fic family protein [Acidobacteria bacterium]|nr:Fic family protein [Acidobacteriota bacterium]
METTPELGFKLPDFQIETRTPGSVHRACFRARKVLEGIVYDTVALENNPFTLPEVKTLIEGITVGGHKIEDKHQVLNQAHSWRRLLQQVETEAFVPFTDGLDSTLQLHALVAKDETPKWDELRTESVGIAGTSNEPPLADTLQRAAQALRNVNCIHTQAIATFLFVAHNQLFWNGNKRTGRLLMNGLLLSAGHDVITVPAKKRQEFNTKMLRFYDTADSSEMVEFLVPCSLDRELTITGKSRQHTGPPRPTPWP